MPLALLRWGSVFRPARWEVSAAAFTLRRSETTSSKARRYRGGAALCRAVFVFMRPV